MAHPAATFDSSLPSTPKASPVSIDFGRPFRFLFDDPRWVRKLAIGGLFNVAALLLVGLFFVYGYCARAARRIAQGSDTPLPEWNENGRDFREGAKLFLIFLIYELPVILLLVSGFGHAASLEWFRHEEEIFRALLGSRFFAALLGSWILALVIAMFLPAALTMAVMKQKFSAGFDLMAILGYIRANAGNYVVAMGVLLFANFVTQYGTIFVFVGVFFAAFWAQLAMTHAFAQTWRHSKNAG